MNSKIFFRQTVTRAVILALLLFTVVASTASAEISNEQLEKVRGINEFLNKISILYQKKDFKTAALGIRRVTAEVAILKQSSNSELDELLAPRIAMLRKLHAQIELKGTVLPPIRLDMTPAQMYQRLKRVHLDASSTDRSPVNPSGKPTIEPDSPKPTTPVVSATPSDPAMAGKPSATPMDVDAAKESDAAMMGSGAMMTASNGKVSFALDVAPLLIKNCNGCHIGGGNFRGGLNLSTFAGIVAGGEGGESIDAGNGGDSMLVQRLRGEGGDIMPPAGRPPLSETEIQLISAWVDQGAKLDVGRDNQPLDLINKMAFAASADPAEITIKRSEMATADVAMVGAGEVIRKTTDHFLLIGPVSESTLDLVAQRAETYAETARKLVKGESGESLFHGKATIYVWPSRYDYSEFAKMVESRGIPKNWDGHWRSDGAAGYIAIVASERDDPKEIAARLVAPILSLAMATRGDVPHWVAEGVGTVAAIRQIKDREKIRQIRRETQAAWATMRTAKSFLDGKMPPEQIDRVGAAVAAEMIAPGRRKNFDRFVSYLGQSQSFPDAFQRAYGMTPTAFVTALKGK